MVLITEGLLYPAEVCRVYGIGRGASDGDRLLRHLVERKLSGPETYSEGRS